MIKLNHLDFRDWKTVADRMNLTLHGGGKLKVSEIRRLIFDKSFTKNKTFKVTFNATDLEEVTAFIKQKRNYKYKEPSAKYCNPLPISEKKYQDLVDLCIVRHAIPEHYHEEYLNLPHCITVRDALAEPDDEEEDVDNDL